MCCAHRLIPRCHARRKRIRRTRTQLSDVRLPISTKRRLVIFRNPFPSNRQEHHAVKPSMIEGRHGDPLLSQLDAAFQCSWQTTVSLQCVYVLLDTVGRFHSGNRLAGRLNSLGLTSVRRKNFLALTWEPVGHGGHRRHLRQHIVRESTQKSQISLMITMCCAGCGVCGCPVSSEEVQ